MANYVEKHDNGYWIRKTRISLDSVVTAFNRGASPETIKRSFPVLSLEEVYGALIFYLANQTKIDKYLFDSEKKFRQEAKERLEDLKKENPDLIERIENARKENEVLV